MLTKENLIAAKKKIKTEKVTIDGLEAWVRSMTAVEKTDCDYKLSQDFKQMKSIVLVKTLCDEQGNRILTDEDQSIIDELPDELVNPAFEAAFNLNGFSSKDKDDQVKN